MMDCSIDWTDRTTAYVCGDDISLICQIRKLANKFPDMVQIQKIPELNHGCICATVPRSWVKIKPPRQISDEQREMLSKKAKSRMAKKNQFALSGD